MRSKNEREKKGGRGSDIVAKNHRLDLVSLLTVDAPETHSIRLPYSQKGRGRFSVGPGSIDPRMMRT